MATLTLYQTGTVHAPAPKAGAAAGAASGQGSVFPSSIGGAVSDYKAADSFGTWLSNTFGGDSASAGDDSWTDIGSGTYEADA